MKEGEGMSRSKSATTQIQDTITKHRQPTTHNYGTFQEKTSSDLFYGLTPSSHYASHKSSVFVDCSVSANLKRQLTHCMPYSYSSCSYPNQIFLGFWSISVSYTHL